MRSPARARLSVEPLEDRSVPAALDPGLAAEPARVNVVMAAEARRADDAAALLAAPFAARVDHLGFGIYAVTLTGGAAAGEAVAYYSARPGVVSAAADAVIRVERAPNDPSYGSLYGMARIGAPAAWDVSTGSPGFAVAVIDTGIDYNHPDLAANVWRNPGEVPGNGLDDDGNGYADDVHGWDFADNDSDPFDDNGHGTHVAGTIGAVGNNGLGVAGVNWSVDLMALRFLGASGSGSTSNAVRALDYAVRMGARVSNNSWGGAGADPALAAAIGRARAAGHVVVAAAGNSRQNIDTSPTYPASYSTLYDNVVTVAATDSADRLAGFSNYGRTAVTLAAPGVGILSTTPGNTYSSFSGTSMATPHVAGAIALHWARNPSLTYAEVIAHLRGSVDPVSGLADRVQTGGRLNVARLLQAASPPVPAAPGPVATAATFSGSDPARFSRLRVTFDRAVDPASFTPDAVALTGPTGAAIPVAGVAAVAGSGDTQFDVTFADQTALGTYRAVVGAGVRDAAGNPMNQDRDGSAGEAADDQFSTTGTLGLATVTVSAAGAGRAVRDFQATSWSLTVGPSVRIADLNVQVSLTHTYTSDLTIRLRGPDGTTVVLFTRHGGGGDDLTGAVFDDEAGRSISAGAAPFAGTFRPFAALAAFDGKLSAGTWTLEVYDGAAQDTGFLLGWSLTLVGVGGAAPLAAAVGAFGFRDGPAAPETSFAAPVAVAPVGPAALPPADGSVGAPRRQAAPAPAAKARVALPVAAPTRPADAPADPSDPGPVAAPQVPSDPFTDPIAVG